MKGLPSLSGIKKYAYNPHYVVVPYVVFSGLWIFFSDGILTVFTRDPYRLSQLSMYKGWFFVAVTGIMLYYLVRRRSVKIQASNESFQTLFRSMAQGVMYQDPSGAILSANPAAEKILAIPDPLNPVFPLSLTRLSFVNEREEFVGPDDLPWVTAIRTGTPVFSTVLGFMVPENPELRWIILDAIPQFREGEKAPFQVFSTFFDITERKRAEDEIVRLNKNLEQRVRERTSDLESFTYTVAHDLRAPLRAIDGYTGILQEDHSALVDEEGKKVIRIIRDNVHQMDRLMDDLLEFSRMGRSEMQMIGFDMGALVLECYQRLTSDEERAKILFYNEDVCRVHADRAMMSHVWINLLSNAIKFSSRQERPEIRVACIRSGKVPVFSIRDNGVGFDMQYRDKLFMVFQRLHSAREYSGTGVGLAIVHRIIHRHGGTIWAESEPGKGAVFYFTLPSTHRGS